MPNHCFFAPKEAGAEIEVDYSATWLPKSDRSPQPDANVSS